MPPQGPSFPKPENSPEEQARLAREAAVNEQIPPSPKREETYRPETAWDQDPKKMAKKNGEVMETVLQNIIDETRQQNKEADARDEIPPENTPDTGAKNTPVKTGRTVDETPLRTGSHIQMALKKAIDGHKAERAANGENVVLGNPNKTGEVVSDLLKMGVVRQTKEKKPRSKKPGKKDADKDIVPEGQMGSRGEAAPAAAPTGKETRIAELNAEDAKLQEEKSGLILGKKKSDRTEGENARIAEIDREQKNIRGKIKRIGEGKRPRKEDNKKSEARPAKEELSEVDASLQKETMEWRRLDREYRAEKDEAKKGDLRARISAQIRLVEELKSKKFGIAPKEPSAAVSVASKKPRLVLNTSGIATNKDSGEKLEIKKDAKAEAPAAPKVPLNEWQKKRSSAIEEALGRLNGKGKLSREEHLSRKKLEEEFKKINEEGYDQIDFQMMAAKRAINTALKKNEDPAKIAELKAEFKKLKEEKEGSARKTEKKVVGERDKPKEKGEARILTPEEAAQKKENRLRNQPVLGDGDIEFLKGRGWTDEDFKKFNDTHLSPEVLQTNLSFYEKEIAEIKERKTKVPDWEKNFPGEKAHLKNLQKKLAHFQNIFGRRKNILEAGQPEIKGSGVAENVPAKQEEVDLISGRKELETRGIIKTNGERGVPSSVVETKKERGDNPEVVSMFEGKKEIRKAISPAEIDKYAEKNQETRENALAKKMLGVLGEQAAEHEAKAEKRGLLNLYRKMGEKIKSLPLPVRVGIGLGLAGGVILTGSAAALATAGVWRFVASSATFVVTEEALRYYSQRGGKERTSFDKFRHTAEALTFSILLGSGLASQGAQNVMAFFRPEIVAAEEAMKSAVKPKLGMGTHVGAPAPSAPGMAAGPGMESAPGATLAEYSVEKGDNLYKIIKSNFSEIADLEGGRQTNAIENILAKIKADPGAFGLKDVNQLGIGNKIDLQKIREIIDTTNIGDESIIEHAEGLSREAVANIDAYAPEEAAAPVDIGVHSPDTAVSGAASNIQDAQDNALVQPSNPKSYNFSYYVDHPEAAAEGGAERVDVLALENTRAAFNAKLDELFGTRGFFRNISGANSKEWLSVKDRAVSSLFSGENRIEHGDKIQNYLGQLAKDSGEMPKSTETIENYIKRAIFTAVKAGKLNAT